MSRSIPVLNINGKAVTLESNGASSKGTPRYAAEIVVPGFGRVYVTGYHDEAHAALQEVEAVKPTVRKAKGGATPEASSLADAVKAQGEQLKALMSALAPLLAK